MSNAFAAQLVEALEKSWPAVARPNQLPPPGDWSIWLLLAGRGFGKTRTLAEWIGGQVASGRAGRIAVVAATAADARDVLVEGESGILAVAPYPEAREAVIAALRDLDAASTSAPALADQSRGEAIDG